MAETIPEVILASEVYELADLAVREAREEVMRIREEEILALSLDLPFEERERIRAVRHWREDALARATARRHRIVNARARVDHALSVLRAEAESVSRELQEVGS